MTDGARATESAGATDAEVATAAETKSATGAAEAERATAMADAERATEAADAERPTATPATTGRAGPASTERPAPTTTDGTAWTSRHWLVLGLGVVAAVLVRALLLPSVGLAGDLNEFAGWIHALATEPFGRAYDRNLTFPPVMVYVWEVLAAVEPRFVTVSDASDPAIRVLLKLPPSLADLGLAAAVGFLLRHRPWLAIAGALSILLHPAVIDLSAAFGQYESIYALFGLLAVVFALGGRTSLAAVALGLALMTKPQALPFLVPFGAWILARDGWLGAVRAAAIGLATIVIVWLPFVPAGGPANYLASIELHQNELYNVLSLRAWNFWTLIQERVAAGQFLNDNAPILGPVTPRHLGYALAGVLELIVLRAVLRQPSPRSLVLGLAAASLVAFGFLTTMHERYAFAAVVFLLVAGLMTRERAILWLWAAFSVVFTVNLLVAIPPTPAFGEAVSFKGPISVAGSLAMLAITAGVLGLLVSGDRSSRPGTSGGSSEATSGA